MTQASMSESRPDFVFEISWEVCNMVGGIHTVLATKASKMVGLYGDHYVVIGPKVWNLDQREKKVFTPEAFMPELVGVLREKGIIIETGRWNVPGQPRCILVDISESYRFKNQILESLWVNFKVDSITGGWDYVEPVLFGYTTGRVIRYWQDFVPERLNVVAHWHEWMVGSGLLYLKKKEPLLASVFTTHATVLGRAIRSSGGDLAEAMNAGDVAERALSLGVKAKFSLERALAREGDCFTTVSSLTADEAEAFLERRADLLLPNALGDAFPDPCFTESRAVARQRQYLLELAGWVTGESYDPRHCFLMMSSGRYEYVNKGINLVVDALPAVAENLAGKRDRVLLFFLLPAGVNGPAAPVWAAKKGERPSGPPLLCSHDLEHGERDPLLNQLKHLGFENRPDQRVHVVFLPIYLDGSDALVERRYYELLAAFDLTLFPSLYEPWGYTPLESIGYGVPTVTSDLAGFGQWAASRGVADPLACYLLERADGEYQASVAKLAQHLIRFIQATPAQRRKAGIVARELSRAATWDYFAKHYLEAHQFAVLTRDKRFPGKAKRFPPPYSPRETQTASPGHPSAREAVTPRLKPFTVHVRLPKPLHRLRELAYNLWWSWNPDAESLFAELQPELWLSAGQNPVRFLESICQSDLEVASKRADYLARLDAVFRRLDAYLEDGLVEPEDCRIAYFCMEFGLHHCLPIYSGGLGVLAGDHVKAAGDGKLPMVAVGLAYRSGYFLQRFDPQGKQLAEAMQLDFTSLPLTLVKGEDGGPFVTRLLFPGRMLTLQVWQVNVGRVPLLLLDTDHPANTQQDREITSRLYGGGAERRLKQEMVLGIGGRVVLEELGYRPKVFHMNEGHAAFLVLSRIGQVMRDGHCDFRTALEYVRHTSIFTTHTPVAAGHDTFPEDMMRPHFSAYRQVLRMPWDHIMDLGRYPGGAENAPFSMTLLGLRGSSSVNGVSKIHERVSKKNLAGVTPGHHWSEVPIGSITNGVHLCTWLAPAFQAMLDSRFKDEWRRKTLTPEQWERLRGIGNGEFREIRLSLKKALIQALRRQIEAVWRHRQDSPGLLARLLANLRENALLVGFARRFAPYKRATLLFSDLEALERIVSREERPVVFLFAGKAHPADEHGKKLAQTIFQLAREERFLGRIVLLENYDMALARYLVQGCDVWLNTPTRPLEASGTSGMKSAINGGLNLSVLDGWWAEGYNGHNGWSIGKERVYHTQDMQDELDSQHLYHLLERTVIPSYFDGASAGPSDDWIAMAKEAMITTLPGFSACRMLNEYHDRYYRPALERAGELAADRYRLVREAAEFKNKMEHWWSQIRIEEVHVEGLENEAVYHGNPINVSVMLHHPHLAVAELSVELVIGDRDESGEIQRFEVLELGVGAPRGPFAEVRQGVYTPAKSGSKAYGIRVVPRYLISPVRLDTELCLVKWA